MPYAEHKAIQTPADGTRLWRYRDFRHFTNLVQQGELYFCRPDLFDDPFECAIPRALVDHLHDSYPDGREVFGDFGDLREHIKNWRKTLFANCWNASEHESAAMWQRYDGGEKSIAIVTTVERLREALDSTYEDVHIGRVHYVDFDSEFDEIEDEEWGKILEFLSRTEGFNQLIPSFYKRKEFSHEEEVRALTLPLEPAEIGPILRGDKCNEEIPEGDQHINFIRRARYRDSCFPLRPRRVRKDSRGNRRYLEHRS